MQKIVMKCDDHSFSFSPIAQNTLEAFYSCLSAHVIHSGTHPWQLLSERAGGEHMQSVKIKCLGHNVDFERDITSDLEGVAFVITVHGNHEGCHLAMKIDDKPWIIACVDHSIPVE